MELLESGYSGDKRSTPDRDQDIEYYERCCTPDVPIVFQSGPDLGLKEWEQIGEEHYFRALKRGSYY